MSVCVYPRQVLTIWEGTTNVLSLDVLRALVKSQGAVLQAFGTDVTGRLQSAAGHAELSEAADKVRKGAESILGFAAQNSSQLEIAARDFAYSIARVAIGNALFCFVCVFVSRLSFRCVYLLMIIFVTFVKNLITAEKELRSLYLT